MARPVGCDVKVLGRVVAEATLVAGTSAALALAVNSVRSDGLPLVARTAYEVLVPCPEPGGEVTPVEAGELNLTSGRTFLIDARASDEHGTAHLPGAINVPYDWLEPLPEPELRALARSIAASRATRVVVYGDGERPDSGEHLGREISGRGIKNVEFVRGGAPALRLGDRR